MAQSSVRPLQIIVVEDGSPEDSESAFLLEKAKYPDVTLQYVRKKNGGPASARNEGVRLAQSDLILPLDVDDKFFTASLVPSVEYLEKHPEIDIVYGNYQCFGDSEEWCEVSPWEKIKFNRINGLVYCSMYRKNVWAAIGGYDEVVPYGVEDWQFWLKAWFRGFKGKKLDLNFLNYNVRPGTLTQNINQSDLNSKAAIIRSFPEAFTPHQISWAEHILSVGTIPESLYSMQAPWKSRVGVMPVDQECLLDRGILFYLQKNFEAASEALLGAIHADKNPEKLVELDNYSIQLEKSLAEKRPTGGLRQLLLSFKR